MVCVSKPKKQQENTAVNILQNFATESRYDSLLTQQNTQVMITSRSLYKLIKQKQGLQDTPVCLALIYLYQQKSREK